MDLDSIKKSKKNLTSNNISNFQKEIKRECEVLKKLENLDDKFTRQTFHFYAAFN